MSQPGQNAAIVERGYRAFNEADIETLSRMFDERASWHTPGSSPVAGASVGRDAVFAQFARYGGETDGSFRASLREVFESGDGRVVGLHHNSGMRSGRRLDTDCCIVFTLEDGRIVEGREHFYDLANWDSFWS
jgi:ketosteroid isomerase-like protein